MVNHLIPPHPQNIQFRNKIPLQGTVLMQHGKWKISFPLSNTVITGIEKTACKKKDLQEDSTFGEKSISKILLNTGR